MPPVTHYSQLIVWKLAEEIWINMFELTAKPQPTDADIDAAMTNVCRCGTYQQVREAIHAAAKA